MSFFSLLLAEKIRDYHQAKELNDNQLLAMHYQRVNREYQELIDKNTKVCNQIYERIYHKLDLLDILMKKNKPILSNKCFPHKKTPSDEQSIIFLVPKPPIRHKFFGLRARKRSFGDIR